MNFLPLEKKINFLNIIPIFFILGNFVSLEDGLHRSIFIFFSAISIFFFVLQVFFSKINLRVEKIIFYYLFLCALTFYFSMFMSSNTHNFYRITFLLITIFVCHSSTLLGDTERIYKNIKNSIFFLTPIIIFFNIIYSGFTLNRMTGFMGNPNALARFCVFLIPFYFVSSIKYFKGKKTFTLTTLLNFLTLFSLIILTFSSTSRGGLFLIFVQAAAFLAYDFNLKKILNIKFIFKIMAYTFLFVFLFTCLYYFGIFDEIIEKFDTLTKFKVSNEGIGLLDITNGRTNLAALIIPYIKENLFGVDPSLLDAPGARLFKGSLTIDPHNNYLSFALKYGFFSSIAFHLLFIYFQFYFYFAKEKNILNLIGFVTNSQIIVYWLFETASVMYPVWLVLILYTLSKKNNIDKIYKLKNNQNPIY